MDTPICDFVRQYAERDCIRLHMPGHKGAPLLGMEPLDITEIVGADSLYEAEGIIRKSEKNASLLFGCPTYYATEGSSQCIRAMLYLAMLHAKKHGKKPIIAAGRNVHKAFVSAIALLDAELMWLYPENMTEHLSCRITPEQLERFLKNAKEKPTAVYLTSPDYPGVIADVEEIAKLCRKHGALLLVDNAHGAYLRFLSSSRFPVDLGADMCCSSAHKTLPVITGGAYLHLSADMEAQLHAQVKPAMALFGTTSPSYLILQSLDAANPYLEGHKQRLETFLPSVELLKKKLSAHGYHLYGNEPMKITIAAKAWGYTGDALAEYLEQENIVCEFSDKDYLVLMPTPQNGQAGLERLEAVLYGVPQKPALRETPPKLPLPEQVLSVREAALSLMEMVPVDACEGRILAATTVGCPPAVPILVSGERIDKQAIECFHYYGEEYCAVVSETEI